MSQEATDEGAAEARRGSEKGKWTWTGETTDVLCCAQVEIRVSSSSGRNTRHGTTDVLCCTQVEIRVSSSSGRNARQDMVTRTIEVVKRKHETW